MTRQKAQRLASASAGAVIAMMAFTPAQAQVTPPADASPRTTVPVEVEGVAAPASSQTIIVTGQRLPEVYAGGQIARGAQLGVLGNETLLDVPLSVTAYTSEYIRNQQANTVADVLSANASTRILTSNRAGTVIEISSIRGFQVNPFNVSFQGLSALTGLSEPLEGYERVEVLQGPSSLLNGFPLEGGVGGTINLIPARAPDRSLTRLTAGYSNDSLFSGAFDIGRRFGSDKQFGIRVNGLYRAGDTAVDRNSSKVGLLAAGFDYRGGAVRLSADVRYTDNRYNQPLFQISVFPGFAVPTAPEAGSSYAQPYAFQNYTNLIGVLRGEVDVAKSVTLFASVGGRRLKGRNLVSLPLLVNGAGDLNDLALFFANDFATVSAEAGGRAAFDTGPVVHRLTIAGSGVWSNRIADGSSAILGAFPSNIYRPKTAPTPNLASVPTFTRNANEHYQGLTISDKLSILDEAIQLTLGARLQSVRINVKDVATGISTDRYKANATTPFVGLTLKPMTNLSLYGSYSEGLDVGGAAPAGSVNAGTFLPPAKLEQGEVGVKYDSGTTLIQFSLFDLRRQSAFTDPVTRVFALAGRQRNRGAELSVAGEPVSGFRVLGGVMYLDGTLTRTPGGANDGRTPVGVPKWTVNAGVEGDILPQLTLTGRMIYTSQQFVDLANTQPIPGWTKFDIGARTTAQLGGNAVTFRLNVENLFDKNYYASSFGALTLGAPRTIALSASVDL